MTLVRWSGRYGLAALSFVALLAAGFAACTRAEKRPSFLLVVMDTTRRDAMSCYGEVAGTTPEVDRLAADGVRYTRAYTAAPWTLPSHASIFTGLLPRHHGIGWRQWHTANPPPLLAERLREHGYETVGFSENVWVGSLSGLDRGFERFALTSPKGGQALKFDGPPVLDAVREWAEKRTDRRPYFLFLNLMGAHKPLAVKGGFLPEGVNEAEAGKVPQDAGEYNCQIAGHERELAILRGLYLAGVAENDEKLAAIRRILGERGLADNLITIVTSDHGEQFGEHNLVDHQFSVREPLLRVPLVVHGGSGAPAVVDEPVSLVDLMPSILGWAGSTPERGGDGRMLPMQSGAPSPPRVLLADYEALVGTDVPYFGGMLTKLRRHCRAADRVDGDMRAVLRFPHKLVWFADGGSELYDLRDDPEEGMDIASSSPEIRAELEKMVGTVPPDAH